MDKDTILKQRHQDVPYIALALVCLFAEAAYMGFELVAQRVMSPWFGNSNIIWTAIIGIILASGALGNWLGGKLADSKDRNFYFIIVLIVSSVLCACIPSIQDRILSWVASLSLDLRLGASLATTLLFFLPSCAMGFLVPMLIASSIKEIENAGKSTGKMYAISTIGGIAGTFIAGFVLIPSMSSTQMVYLIATVFVLSSFPFIIIYSHKYKKSLLIFALCLLITNIAGIVFSNNIYFGHKTNYFEKDTQYSKVIVYDDVHDENGLGIRVMNVGGGYESITYLDEDKRNELVSPYLAQYDSVFRINADTSNILMIGGAGYSYPKHVISHYLDKRIDVVEIDEQITAIAKDKFFLQDLIDQYQTDENNRLGLINEDGRIFLNNCASNTYDVILNDAFTGIVPPPSLCTLEAIEKIKHALKSDGIYATNIIAPEIDEEKSMFIRCEMKTISQVFNYVKAVKCSPDNKGYSAGNYIVFASDFPIPELEGAVGYFDDTNNKYPVLTDDYCPVEYLSYKKFS